MFDVAHAWNEFGGVEYGYDEPDPDEKKRPHI